MRTVLDPAIAAAFPRGLPPGSRYYAPGAVLDQGPTGTCVAHGWASWSYGAPLMMRPDRFPKPFDLYRECVMADEWEDNDIDATQPDAGCQSGTSVRAGAKVLQRRGHVKSYLWARSVEDVRAWHLAGFGGVVLGINWTDSMFDTDRNGFITYRGPVIGGHCIRTTGWSDDREAVRIQNSWGTGWGDHGRAWIRAADLARLIQDDGEACAAIEQAVKPARIEQQP
jgi:hypothetical protein